MNKNLKPVLKTGLFKLLLSFLLFFLFFSAKSQTVTGTVSDQSGKRLSAVSVSVKGTTIGTTTNEAGSFSINAPANSTLVFS